MSSLTDKQETFCREYLIDLNATQAAIRSGYSKKTANRIATENLSKLVIQKRIDELKSKRNDRTQIDADWVLYQLKEVYDLAKEKTDLKNSLKALDQIAKHVDVKAYDRTVPLTTEGDNSLIIQVNNKDAKDQLQELKDRLQ